MNSSTLRQTQHNIHQRVTSVCSNYNGMGVANQADSTRFLSDSRKSSADCVGPVIRCHFLAGKTTTLERELRVDTPLSGDARLPQGGL